MNSLLVRGILALVLVVGTFGYALLYQMVPPAALIGLATLAVGYFFGHPDVPLPPGPTGHAGGG